jgi:16S rRNA (adenine1518-N6/adenine1519-N6)-dimethyltransferase
MGSEELRVKTFAVIDGAFSQRRKTLRQALADLAGSPAQAEELLTKAGVSPQARGEQLVIDDFIKIAKQL